MASFERNFLDDLWERKGENEVESESPENRSFGIFLDMKIGAEKNPDLSELVRDLEGSLLRYTKAEVVFARARLKWEAEGNTPESRNEFEAADRNKHAIHQSVISQLNAVSRAFHRHDLDNSWRKEIGVNRDQIAAWALMVADHITADTLKEHGLEA